MKKKAQDLFQKWEAKRQELLQRFSGYSHEQLNRQIIPGKWSLLQETNHLIKSESLSLAYIQKKIQDPSRSKTAGMGNALRMWLTRLILSAPLKFKAPVKALLPPEEVFLEETIQSWENIRHEWNALIESLPEEVMAKELWRHPVAGRFNLVQTLEFHHSHMDHHTRQMAEKEKKF